MPSQPPYIHQRVSMEISRQFANYSEGKQIDVLAAPFAVQLSVGSDRIVVEPDISIVCDFNKLDEFGCKGAPDLIVEITSATSAREDTLVKLELYQRAKVREYWIVSPEIKTVYVFLLDGNAFKLHEVYSPPDPIKVNILDGCFIELSKVFPA